MGRPPFIGLTANHSQGDHRLQERYARCIVDAGGVPVIVPPQPIRPASVLIDRLDGLVFTGGGDLDTRPYGTPLHPQARLGSPSRQQFEEALLRHLSEQAPDFPVFGICLGMQLMGVLAAGELEQHLPDVLERPEIHAGDHIHRIDGEMGEGWVTSSHHQALKTPGGLRVVATADDGVIEAVVDRDRRFYFAVQWHPERTADDRLGMGLFRRLVAAASGARTSPF